MTMFVNSACVFRSLQRQSIIVATKFRRAGDGFESSGVLSSALFNAGDTVDAMALAYSGTAECLVEQSMSGAAANVACVATHFEGWGFQLKGFSRSLKHDWQKLPRMCGAHNKQSPGGEIGFLVGGFRDGFLVLNAIFDGEGMGALANSCSNLAAALELYVSKLVEYRTAFLDGDYETAAILLDEAGDLMLAAGTATRDVANELFAFH